MSELHDYIRKKYVTCILFAHQGLQKPHSVVRYPVREGEGVKIMKKMAMWFVYGPKTEASDKHLDIENCHPLKSIS